MIIDWGKWAANKGDPYSHIPGVIVICNECRQRADMNQGCDTACPVGCDCQHRARREITDEPTADPKDC